MIRAWRDESVANQVLEPRLLAFTHEESSHSLISRASTHFVFKHVASRDGRIVFMNACYVREVLTAEE